MTNGTRQRVLVTGAAGYVGSVLCQELLDRGHAVCGIDSFAVNNESSIFGLVGHPHFSFDLRDVRHTEMLRPFVGQADAVVWLAAVVGGPACDRSPAYAKQVNQDSLLGLKEILSPHQRLVFPNTESVYGETEGSTLLTEEAPAAPISLYARTKHEAEKVVLDHPLGVSLRLATVFGVSPRMRFDLLVNDFTYRIATQGRLEVFEPAHKRSFVHVRDVARAFARMVDDHRQTGPFNVGLADANLSKLELAHKIAGTLGFYPADVVTVGEGSDPDKRNYIVSSQKLLSLGFQFRHGLEDGVREVALVSSLTTPPAFRRMRNA